MPILTIVSHNSLILRDIIMSVLSFRFMTRFPSYERSLFLRRCSSIARVNNLNEVTKIVTNLGQNALVAFDVDKTLIIPKDTLAIDSHYSTAEKMIKRICGDLCIEQDQTAIQSMIYLYSQKRVIDLQSREVIKWLNQKRIKTIALTALSRGPYGIINDVLQWRIDELRQFGYNFEIGFSPDQCFQFKDTAPSNALLAFKRGVLFSSNMPKGHVLKSLLNRLNWQPSEIVFVDDQLKHLQSVAETAQKMGVISHLFHYTAAENTGEKLNELHSEFQIRYLIKHGKWLSDEEVAFLYGS